MHSSLKNSKPIETKIMKPNHLSAVALLAFLAGGCANIPSVGPDYHKPNVSAPAQWNPLAGRRNQLRRGNGGVVEELSRCGAGLVDRTRRLLEPRFENRPDACARGAGTLSHDRPRFRADGGRGRLLRSQPPIRASAGARLAADAAGRAV